MTAALVVISAFEGLNRGDMIGRHLFCFALGMLIQNLGRTFVASMTARAAAVLGVWSTITLVICRPVLSPAHNQLSIAIEGVASTVLVSVVAFGPACWLGDVLSVRPLRFLGRISYSFYLYHLLVLGLVLRAALAGLWMAALSAPPLLTGIGLGIVSALFTVPIAIASSRMVERPCIELGRAIEAWHRRWLGRRVEIEKTHSSTASTQ